MSSKRPPPFPGRVRWPAYLHRLVLASLSLALLLIGTYPAGLWATSWLAACRASLFLGHWPRYGRPDPKDLPDQFWSAAPLSDGGLTAVVAVLVVLILWCLAIRQIRSRAWVPLAVVGAVLMFAAGWARLSEPPEAPSISVGKGGT